MLRGQVYALEPAVLVDESTHQTVGTGFSLGTGRWIAAYPKKWQRMVHDAVGSDRPVLQAAITEALRHLSQAVIKQPGAPSTLAPEKWLSEAEKALPERAWTAIIASENPRAHAAVCQIHELSPFAPPWQVQTTPEWNWLNQLEDLSQRWLCQGYTTAILTPSHWSEIALHLHRTAELELRVRIFESMRDHISEQWSEPMSTNQGIRDCYSYLTGVSNIIMLGSMRTALSFAANPETTFDTQLANAIRLICQDGEPPNILSPIFRGEIANLAEVRRGNAHTDDVDPSHIQRMEKFMIEDNQPGLFFRAINIRA